MISRTIQKLGLKISTLITRAVVRAVDNSGRVQTVTTESLFGATHEDVERLQEYGFTSVPPTPCEAIQVHVGGAHSHAVLVGTNVGSLRPTSLGSGDAAMYTESGVCVLCSGDTVGLGVSPSDFVARASLVDARILALQTKLDDLISKYDLHIHDPGTQLPVPMFTDPVKPTYQVTPLGSQDSVASDKVSCT